MTARSIQISIYLQAKIIELQAESEAKYEYPYNKDLQLDVRVIDKQIKLLEEKLQELNT